VSRTKNLSNRYARRESGRLLRISEVARRLGISSSALRSWEALGLVAPRRTESRYRLYSEADVRLLQRALFLRRARGLNPAGIVHFLKGQGIVSVPRTPAPGRHFRTLRLARGVSLVRVARAARISVGFLSALERGQMTPSIATMRRLARFFRTNILSFFEATGENRHLMRPAERKILDAGPKVRMELLAFGNTVMEPHLFRIKPNGGSGESYSHEGEEFLYILSGQLEIWLDERDHYRLSRGDSFYFKSATPHRWRNPGRAETLALWINTPPTF
jgi:DNA-binding transcriptional MerR regulator/mannose-6-phosphate isomerase-like protein (cupin superfamily)